MQRLTTVLEELVGKPQRGSMEAFIFHRNITNPFTFKQIDKF